MDSSQATKLVKKIQLALKLGGFSIRTELCREIYEKYRNGGVELSNNDSFEDCIVRISKCLENQCTAGQSIEMDHITKAIEVCLNSGYDESETIFNVLNAFDFPKFRYNADRKIYFPTKTPSKLLADADGKAQLFLDRYYTILQRTKRSFAKNVDGNNRLKLQTVDFLLTLSTLCLEHTLILGSILQVSEGKYCLEDPTGVIQLNLTHAKYHGGFFVENGFVLINGLYEDKILQASTIILPPGEEYADSRPSFGNLNYFGGLSKCPLRDSQRLKEHLMKTSEQIMLFFSDVWLDHPLIFDKLEVLLDGMQHCPPVAFVFMGNFMSESHGGERINILKKLFKQLAELIVKYETLVDNSQFVFVPGMTDPCTSHIVPKLPLPSFVTEGMTKILPKAIFPSNPCRLQFCDKELTIFRADILAKFLQGTLHKPKKDEIADCVTRTIISQGHLSPLSLNALPVHWDYDYALRLYPLPDLVVIGDKSESYQGQYKNCSVINPGSFCENGFQFLSYTPYNGMIEECGL